MAVREARDITRGEVAKATGVDPSTVSLWEADKKSPREDTLAKLAEFLGTTPAALRYGVSADTHGLAPTPTRTVREELEILEKPAAKVVNGGKKKR